MKKFILFAGAVLALASCSKPQAIARGFDWKVMLCDSNGTGYKIEVMNVVVGPVEGYEADSTKAYNQIIDADLGKPQSIINSYLIY